MNPTIVTDLELPLPLDDRLNCQMVVVSHLLNRQFGAAEVALVDDLGSQKGVEIKVTEPLEEVLVDPLVVTEVLVASRQDPLAQLGEPTGHPDGLGATVAVCEAIAVR